MRAPRSWRGPRSPGRLDLTQLLGTPNAFTGTTTAPAEASGPAPARVFVAPAPPDPPAVSPWPLPARRRSHPRWQGLDGLRALAVIAVVVFHFGLGLPGGFLGVDVFFGISGYLITRLLAREFLETGRVAVPLFYRRRARRLLPALGIVLVVVSSAALIWRDQLATVRGMVVSSGLFSANWWLAFDHQSYFVATGRPTMLQHLWSLGVEEQFYLFWPLILAATLVLARSRVRRSGTFSATRVMRPLCAVALSMAFASTGLTWWLADRQHVPYGSDGSFLYYGTDTHCMGLLLGAALGAWAAGRAAGVTADRPSASWLQSRWMQPAVTVLGVAGLGGLVACCGWMTEYTTWLYRGGFLLVAAAVCAVMAAATRPGHWLGRWLDLPPLRWLGVRSYSIYLWHWPVAVVTRPGLDLSIPTASVQLLRVVATIVLADLTYRYVEVPARRAGLRASLAALGHRVRSLVRGPSLTAVAASCLASVAALATVVIAIGPAAPVGDAALAASRGGTHLSLGSGSSHHRPAATVSRRHRPADAPKPASAGGPRHSQHHARPGSQVRHSSKPHAIALHRGHRLPRLSGFGDSVLLGARRDLGRVFAGGTIDAIEGRQPGPILADVRDAARAGRLAPIVVLHVGDNGLIDPDDLSRTLHDLAATPLVLVLTDHIDAYDGDWQTPNNNTIRRIAPRFRNTVVVDWNHIASQHRSWLYSDDIHLRPAGAAGYTHAIAQAVRASQRRHRAPTTASTSKGSGRTG